MNISRNGSCCETPKIDALECKESHDMEKHSNNMQIPIQSNKPCPDSMKLSIHTDSDKVDTEQENGEQWKFIAFFLDKLCFCSFAILEVILFFLTCFQNL